jgi:ATP-binding protein involved in chromosome partitioning
MKVTSDDILALLSRTLEPYSNKAYSDWVKPEDLILHQDGSLTLTCRPGFAVGSVWPAFSDRLREVLISLGFHKVELKIEPKIESHAIRPGVDRVPGVKNIIAVASGKGGVGKSTTAVNLALALEAQGAAVGLLDADIYGPSVPLLLGLSGRPDTSDGKTMQPLLGFGVKANSIGFLVAQDTPAIWRGPMVTQALEQLLRQTNWGQLDYLIVDMPPGTGDIALTLAQKVPVTGAVIVSTPQDIALLDARKGVKMFEKVDVPVLGVIENMAVHICSNCGHVEHLFGRDGAQKMASEFKIPFLGSLPLALEIRQDADAGYPTVVASPDSSYTQLYRDIARRISARIATMPKDMASKFPSIVVEQRRN